MSAPSLRWRITRGLVLFQILIFVVISSLTVGLVFNASPSGVIVGGKAIRAVTASTARDAGGLILTPNAELQRIQDASPDLWFIVQSGEARLTHGAPPPFAMAMMDDAPRIKVMDIRGEDADPHLTARFEHIGDMAIILGGGGYISDVWASIFLANIVVLVPALVLIGLTLLCVPPFIRRSLRRVTDLSRQVARIDYDSRGSRLATEGLPREIVPLAQGMNEALRRLDAGFETTERFFMNAAHELRTPIAIIQLRLDALPASAERESLRQITRRLAALARQLLEIERFRQAGLTLTRLDLRAVLSDAVADLAPYALAEGYDLSLDSPDAPVWVQGDRAGLDRMVVNLIQNAVQHGGGRGAITVRLSLAGVIEVQDQGPGIPEPQRARVFEPFFRRNPHGAGAGLGLKMVRDIARAHGGDVVVADAAPGATFRVSLPVSG
ncbi:MAG: HAMP domain-containing sensor histidine kinase [Paracoccus sp. (in: a-proteobacteria)]|nr:HAMP domain-containing sensor histidine kinase [Paracoccus sp. (in: a-proteobacteria)]